MISERSVDLNRLPAPDYQHTQRGTLIRALLLAIGVVEVAIMLIWLLTDKPSVALPLVVLALTSVLVGAFVLVGSLTVIVDGQHLRVSLGTGLVHRTIPIGEIEACHPVRNRWWYGWGIRLTPRGWLWNVSGLDAVELTDRSGKHFRVGTDEPRQLCEAIDASITRGWAAAPVAQPRPDAGEEGDPEGVGEGPHDV